MPWRIFSRLAALWWSSPSIRGKAWACATAAPRLDLPQPATPMTTRKTGDDTDDGKELILVALSNKLQKNIPAGRGENSAAIRKNATLLRVPALLLPMDSAILNPSGHNHPRENPCPDPNPGAVPAAA